MKVYVTRINETEYLSEEAEAAVGNYYGYYLYTPGEITNCCEITPSYWLEAAGFDTDRYDEDVYSKLLSDLPESSHYRHWFSPERAMESEFFGDFDTLEEAVNYFQANPRYF